jgi:hypothetical protein
MFISFSDREKEDRMNRRSFRTLICFIPLILVIPAFSAEKYHNPGEVNQVLKTWSNQYGNVTKLISFGKSTSGNDILGLQIAAPNPGGSDPERRPAVFVTANIEGNHMIGTEAALRLVEKLLSGYEEDTKITELLQSRTVYVAPLLNPDVAGFYFEKIKFERSFTLLPMDDDLDGVADEDGPDDLDNDGFITQMRIKDPEGTMLADPNEPRLLRQADAKKGEKGLYKVYSEGIDNDGDGLYNEDPRGGVMLNRNFPHDFEYNVMRAGLHPFSEAETNALIKFMLSKPNIAMVLNFSSENTFLNLQQTGKAQAGGNTVTASGAIATMLGMEEGKEYKIEEAVDIIKNSGLVPPGMEIDESIVAMIFGLGPAMAIDNQDMPFIQEIQKQYKDALKEAKLDYPENRAQGVIKGSFAAYCYFQHGVPVFSSDLWQVPEPKKEPAQDALTAEKLKDMSPDEFVALGEEKIAAFLKEQGTPDNVKPEMVINMVKSGKLKPAQIAEMLEKMPKKPGAEGEHPEAYILNWASGAREDQGFTDWKPYVHPTLGEVEIGGFRPYVKTVPPPSLMDSTLDFHADFYISLMGKLGEIELVETDVETLADGVYKLTAYYTNNGWFPTSTAQGRRARAAWPIRVELKLSQDQNLFSGNRVVTIPFIGGSGDVQKAEWTIRAKRGSKVSITAVSPRLGELKTEVALQ